ncbi:hypothetical protein I317_00995 [Kwoniella heveanensis CBS 569]|nr:hypothetical protein I317_00995 [Kwoniella heveanensis CBS 569]
MSDSNQNNVSEDGHAHRLHPDFSEGDVTFLSKDGVEFKVSGKPLAARSDVFKAMLQMPQADGVDKTGSDGLKESTNKDSNSHKPIHFDVKSTVLESFLAMLICPIPMMPATTFEETCEIYKMCYKYECANNITEMGRVRLAKEGKRHVLEVVRLASKPGHDDWHLGRLALEQLGDQDFIDIFTMNELRELPSAWAGRILTTAYWGPRRGQFIDEDSRMPSPATVLEYYGIGNWSKLESEPR